MPCSGGHGWENAYSGCDHGNEIKELKDALCSLASELKRNGVKIPAAAAPMVAAHEEEDRRRIAVENAQRERAKLKEQAISKLTNEELDALGIRGEGRRRK